MDSIPVQFDQMFQTENLVFSADAVLETWGNARGLNIGEEDVVAARGNESDCSWTHEEENGTSYLNIHRQLEDFIKASDQMTMTTSILSRHQRRFVHASAQIMCLGHASLGAQGKYRRMILFKDDNCALRASSLLSDQQRNDLPDDPLEAGQISPSGSISRKRRRQSRVDGGFRCQYTACHKVFDRASERTKHEQSHQPTFTTRYQCLQCEKGFRYPKDLRRHRKVHGKETATDLWSLNNTAPPSTLASESRVPSDTSLTFCSTNISKENSPKLVPWTGEELLDFEMAPLVHDLNSWTISTAHLFHEHNFQCQVLEGCGLEQEDVFDEELLEMARVKK